MVSDNELGTQDRCGISYKSECPVMRDVQIEQNATVYQVKMELEKRDLQCFPEWGGTALSEFWEGEEERIGCRWVKSLLNLLPF